MATEVKHRRHRGLGHVLRMEQTRIPKKGLGWNSAGNRKLGRPKMNQGKTLEGTFMGNGRREKQKRDIHGRKGVAALS